MHDRRGVDAALAPFPWLAAALDHLLAALAGRVQAVAVRGSIARGVIDEYSDLDLVVTADPEDAGEILHQALAGAARLGTVAAAFAADHIGMPDLWIILVRHADRVVKIDVEIVPPSAAGAGEDDVVLLGERRMETMPAAPPDLVKAAQRCCGWLWYTHCRICRGELFEAANTLHTMRRLALLPFVLAVHGLTDDFRRLEQLLDENEVARLLSTYPETLSPFHLAAALENVVGAVVDLHEPAAARGYDVGSTAGIQSVLEVVRADRARETDTRTSAATRSR